MGVLEGSDDSIEGGGTPTAPAGPGPEALGAVDLDDPQWAPIEGITLDQYARITAALARQDGGPSEQTRAWLETQGIAPGTWGQVQAGWVNRMSRSEAVRTRYGVLYVQG